MDRSLYPLKFSPIYKQVIWGGEKLRNELGKSGAPENTGESWEISGVKDNVSIVTEGFLKGNSLEELIEVYMGNLVGDAVFDSFGTQFPVLIKFIHANDHLSVQVHPDDAYSATHHGSRGKTEMWYIVDADAKASLISGFSKDTSSEEFVNCLKEGNLVDILNFEEVQRGDVFFLPARRIHAIGKGIVLAEIQQTSDVTYRVYDWDRKGPDGKSRELHLDHAMQVLDFSRVKNAKTAYTRIPNQTVNLVDCPYFTTSIVELDQPVDKDFSLIDSFVVYMCVEGKVMVNYRDGKPVMLEKGETILVPAEIKEISLIPSERSTLLEVYMKQAPGE